MSGNIPRVKLFHNGKLKSFIVKDLIDLTFAENDNSLNNSDKKIEKWKRIPLDLWGLNYEVSSKGIIRNRETKRCLTNHIRAKYMGVSLSFKNKKKTFSVHYLVALTFIPNEDKTKTQVNHKDGNKENNSVKNLEWTTPSENIRHAIKEGLFQNRSTAVKCLDMDGKLVGVFPNILAASKATGANDRHISCVCREKRNQTGGYRWEYVDKKVEIMTALPEGKQYMHFDSYIWTLEGKCYSKRSKTFLKETQSPSGMAISLSKKGEKVKRVLVHRVVAELFISNPNNYGYVKHQNGNKQDNRVENLKWSDSSICSPKKSQNK